MDAARRLPGLDLLRSIAIVWVMLFHTFLIGGLGPDWSWLSRFGWMGVDLFFVLSGFLIGSQVLQGMGEQGTWSLADFYLRRALRILPAYWVVLALYTLWPSWREAPGMEPWWKFALFIVNLDIDYGQRAAFSHAWSLCVEEHFYWFFPLLAAALVRRPDVRAVAALALAIVLAGIAWRGVAWWQGTQADPTLSQRNWFVEDIYYPTWCRLDGLLCGVGLAAWKTLWPQSWAQARRRADVAALVAAAVMALAFWLFSERVGWLANTLGWPVLSLGMGLWVFSAAGRDSVIGKRAVPGAAWLAAISYSLYLVHKAVYHLVQLHWGGALSGRPALAVLAYGSAAVAAGAVLHYAVERPCVRLRPGRGNRALSAPEPVR